MDLSEIAAQLRNPEGETGIIVGNKMNELNNFITHFAYDLMNVADNDHVLEIGLGNGKFVSEIIAKGSNIFFAGIDYSKTMIDEAKINNQKLLDEAKIELQQADLSKIPYEGEFFNKICTINTLYFWNNPQSDIKEVYRVLSADGIFVLAIRPKENMQGMAFTKFGFKLYDLEDVKNLLVQGGFRIINCFEKDEPPALFNDIEIHPKSLCIVAEKSKAEGE